MRVGNWREGEPPGPMHKHYDPRLFDVLDEDAHRDPHATPTDGESRATESENSADADAPSTRIDPTLTAPRAPSPDINLHLSPLTVKLQRQREKWFAFAPRYRRDPEVTQR